MASWHLDDILWGILWVIMFKLRSAKIRMIFGKNIPPRLKTLYQEVENIWEHSCTGRRTGWVVTVNSGPFSKRMADRSAVALPLTLSTYCFIGWRTDKFHRLLAHSTYRICWQLYIWASCGVHLCCCGLGLLACANWALILKQWILQMFGEVSSFGICLHGQDNVIRTTDFSVRAVQERLSTVVDVCRNQTDKLKCDLKKAP